MAIDTTRIRSTEAAAVVARGFSHYASLSEDESNFITAQASNVQRYPARTELVREGSDSSSALFLLAGWACRAKTLADGRRQILEFLLPGDVIGFTGMPGGHTLAPSHALTAVTVAPASQFQREIGEPSAFAHFGDLRRALALRYEQRLINQIVRAGRQTAYERLAHLLLEFHDRLSRVGLANGNSYSMPLTQEMLADGLGLSVVHVNRTLQQLRREKLVIVSDGSVTILEPLRLAQIADFKAAA